MPINAYHTNDLQKLLELKRLEADALRDVLRTINQHDLDIPRLCTITRNILRAQLGVKKMVFFYEEKGDWKEGIRTGFEALGVRALDELLSLSKIVKVESELLPHLSQAQAEYVIPVNNRGLIKAYFVIADFAHSEKEAESDLIFIETIGHILYVAIQNQLLIRERVQQESLKHELEVASTIQRQLLISDFSRFREIDIFGLNIPHHGVGGDFFDVIKKGKGTTFVCIADVSGKGIGAALLMSNLQANLRASCAHHENLEEIVAEMNRILYKITKGEKFVTLFLAKIDSINRTCTYVNAGHSYPILEKKGVYSQLESKTLILGIMPKIEVTQDTFTFEEKDTLLMFTDGVPEQHNMRNDMFETDRIIESLQASQGLSIEWRIERLSQELRTFAAGTDMVDDITLLGISFK